MKNPFPASSGGVSQSVSFHPQLDLFGPSSSADPVLGLAVQPANACRHCDDAVAIVGPGKGPHAASMCCRSCGCHRGWLSRANHTFINNLIDAGEPLREPFILPSKPEPDSDGVSVVHHHDMQKE